MYHWCSQKIESNFSMMKVMSPLAGEPETLWLRWPWPAWPRGLAWPARPWGTEGAGTSENLRIPKRFKKFGGWFNIMFVLLHPDWWLVIHYFQSAFFMCFLIYLHFTNYLWNAFGNLMNSLWCQILPHKMPRTWLMWGDAKPPAARKAQTPTKTLQQPGNPKKWHVPCC